MRKLHLSPLIVKKVSYSWAGGLLAVLLAGIILLPNVSPQTLYRRAIRHLKVSAAPAASSAPKPRGCCANEPATSRRMIGTYYTTEDNFKSSLVLNNKGPNQIVVTPILHSQDGRTFTASPVATWWSESLKRIRMML